MEKTKRKLPVHTIEGTDFIVNVEKQALVQAADHNNIIHFADLENKGSHYEMLYDLRDKNSPPGVGPMDDKMITIHIPLMNTLDPAGVAEKYGVREEALIGKTDTDIMGDLKNRYVKPEKPLTKAESRKLDQSLPPFLREKRTKRRRI